MKGLPDVEAPLWDDLAEGELEDDELAFLRALASGDEDEEARVEAFVPLGERAEEKIAAQLHWRLRSETASRTREETRPGGAPASRRWRRVAPAGVALAAAVTLLFVWPRGDAPHYEARLVGGMADARAEGDSAEVPRFGPRSRFELRLRPETSSGELHASMFLMDQHGEVEPWSVDVERSAQGSMRIRGDAATLFGERRGAWTVIVALGRERLGKDAPKLRAPAEGAIFHFPIELVGP